MALNEPRGVYTPIEIPRTAVCEGVIEGVPLASLGMLREGTRGPLATLGGAAREPRHWAPRAASPTKECEWELEVEGGGIQDWSLALDGQERGSRLHRIRGAPRGAAGAKALGPSPSIPP